MEVVKKVLSPWKWYVAIAVGIIVIWLIWRWRVSCNRAAKRKSIDKYCATVPESESIFVAIPSYRDPQCSETIFDLFEKAACPFRITVGVCQQNYPIDEDSVDGYKRMAHRGVHDFSGRIRMHRISADEAKGPMYARHLIEKHLYRGEKYYLTIDAHMLFTPNWDKKLIKMWKICKEWSPKPILTMYPDDFKPYNRTWSIPNYENQPPSYLRFKKFNEQTGLVEIEGPKFKRVPSNPSLSLFWAAGFTFGLGSQIAEVPFDPHCHYTFLGEEISMGARLWTSGYDFYHPTTMVVYHMWERQRPTFWQQFNGDSDTHKERKQLEQEGYKRLQCLLGLRHDGTVMAPYGLGNKRSLRQYEEFIGIDMANKKFTNMAALVGVPTTVKSDDVLTRFGTWKEFRKTQETMQEYVNEVNNNK
jgi:hypothetical protein